MHRTEGTNHDSNMFTDGPPGTKVDENFLNAVQEEIANVIEESGIALKTAATDTRDQLKTAMDSLYMGRDSITTYGNSNTGAITVASTDTNLLDSDSFTGTTGDMFIVNASAYFEKGATGGNCRLEVRDTTGSNVRTLFGTNSLIDDMYVEASGTSYKYVSAIFIVQGDPGASDTLTMRLRGKSAGSNSNVPIGDARIGIAWLIKQNT